ncbi:MAG: alpha/beta hydrolase [Candidatus Binatia bacterium]
MNTDEVRIRFPSGDVELDGRLALPETCTRACVVCHPHPLYGGDMSNPVVVAVTRAMAGAGIATLRFDFRGVGESGGSHGGGAPEVEDARAAVDALRQATSLTNVAIAGYSFGSVIALRLAAENAAAAAKVAAVAAIAPPLVMFDAAGLAAGLRIPLLVMAGDRDTYCPRPDFESLRERLPASAEAVVVPGADHFFSGREADVAAAVLGWIQRIT